MNVVVAGYDGYIGNALTQRLLKRGHKVIGVDDFTRRYLVKSVDSISAIPVMDPIDKDDELRKIGDFESYHLSIDDYYNSYELLEKHKPDVFVNLAHIPSAPYSMKRVYEAEKTLKNNIIGTNNILWAIANTNKDIHYITIGTTGEYDHYSNIDIEEGYFSFEHNGRKSKEMIYPRRANSIYHASKISSTYIIDYMTRIYNLRCTDIMQAVVVGMYTDETNETRIFSRLDTDDCFGTAVNRFVVQALLGKPLTIFGEGKHQRGFLTLNDSIQALEIAVNNKPEPGKVQTWNQLSTWHSINEIANMVKNVIPGTKFESIPSPRKEYTGEHYYHYKTDILKSLGYKPTRTIEEEIKYMVDNIPEWDDEERNILIENIKPKVKFGG